MNGITLKLYALLSLTVIIWSSTSGEDNVSAQKVWELEQRIAELQAEIEETHRYVEQMDRLLLTHLIKLQANSLVDEDDHRVVMEKIKKALVFQGSRGKRMEYFGSRGKKDFNFAGSRGKKSEPMRFFGNRGKKTTAEHKRGLQFMGSRG